MDTAKGIAAWWVRCDEVAAQAALDRLIACGVVATYTLTSGTLYGLTRDQDLRSRLRTTYGRGPETQADSFRGSRPLLSHKEDEAGSRQVAAGSQQARISNGEFSEANNRELD